MNEAVIVPTPRAEGRARWRLASTLWLAGMVGVVALNWLVLPDLIARQPLPQPLPMPMWALQLLSGVQSGVLLALAVWAGIALAAKLGLHAPAFEALAARASVRDALRPQWRAGVAGGLVVGALLLLAAATQPPALEAANASIALPLAVRVLYGGVTEELLLRWGVMSLLLWAAWRGLQRGQGAPRTALVWLAILASALLFALGHLPAAYSLIGGLDGATVVWVVGFNTLAGLLFGGLYWRFGLEAAMLAHALAHIVAAAVLR